MSFSAWASEGGAGREIPGCGQRHENREALTRAINGQSRPGAMPVDTDCGKLANQAAEICESEPENKGLEDAEKAGESRSAFQLAKAQRTAQNAFMEKASACAEAREKVKAACDQDIKQIEEDRDNTRQAKYDAIEEYKKGSHYASEETAGVAKISFEYDEMDRKFSKMLDAHKDTSKAADKFLEEEGHCKMNHAIIYDKAASRSEDIGRQSGANPEVDGIKNMAGAEGAASEASKGLAEAGMEAVGHAAGDKGIHAAQEILGLKSAEHAAEAGGEALEHGAASGARSAIGKGLVKAAPFTGLLGCAASGGGPCAVTSTVETATHLLVNPETLQKALPVLGVTAGGAVTGALVFGEAVTAPSSTQAAICDNFYGDPVAQYHQCGFYTFSTQSANEVAIQALVGK